MTSGDRPPQTSLDRDVASLLRKQGEAGIQRYSDVGVVGARAAFERVSALRREGGERIPVASVHDDRVGAGSIPVRYYWPALTDSAPPPLVVYFHGGGWVMGDLESHDAQARSICVATGAVVCSVDYRLAPEFPYPAAFEDALAITEYVFDHAAELGIEHRAIAVAGDSAGGNLAAAVALALRGRRALCAQLLNYATLDLTLTDREDHPVLVGTAIDSQAIEWFADQYIPDKAMRSGPSASPLQAEDLTGVAPALVVSAGFDPLCEESALYAARLNDAGVDVTLIEHPSLSHGFFMYASLVPAAASAVANVYEHLRLLLHGEPVTTTREQRQRAIHSSLTALGRVTR